MTENLQNDLILRACNKLPVERTPVWIMRQAGRYLPEYRKVRKKADFLTMCKTPELAAEVTLQPIEIIGVDAAIIFSDILVIPEAMGMELQMLEGQGPNFLNPIRNKTDFRNLKKIDAESSLKYVLDAISLVKRELNGRVPLIGFSGSPWTLLTYMVEGKGSKNFSNVKKLIFNEPELAHEILDFIADAVTNYLSAQIESGVNLVQIFDTWGGILSPSHFEEFSLRYISHVIQKLKRDGQPVILFAKGMHDFVKLANSGADVISVDWTVNIGEVRKITGSKVALQGNLDPAVLYANFSTIETETEKVLRSYGYGSGHIFNLGHGILPDVNPENAKFLVDYIKNNSSKYHKEIEI